MHLVLNSCVRIRVLPITTDIYHIDMTYADLIGIRIFHICNGQSKDVNAMCPP